MNRDEVLAHLDEYDKRWSYLSDERGWFSGHIIPEIRRLLAGEAEVSPPVIAPSSDEAMTALSWIGDPVFLIGRALIGRALEGWYIEDGSYDEEYVTFCPEGIDGYLTFDLKADHWSWELTDHPDFAYVTQSGTGRDAAQALAGFQARMANAPGPRWEKIRDAMVLPAGFILNEGSDLEYLTYVREGELIGSSEADLIAVMPTSNDLDKWHYQIEGGEREVDESPESYPTAQAAFDAALREAGHHE